MQERPETTRPTTAGDAGLVLPVLGLLIGVWAIIPPYIGAFGDLNVEQRVEFADHVIPGIAVLAVSVLAFLTLRSAEPGQLLLSVGGAVITLAGIWMVATHLPLIDQGRDDLAPWGAVIWHSVPGLVVTLLGIVWTIRFWGADEDEAESGR